MTRIDKWKKEKHTPLGIKGISGNEDLRNLIKQRWDKHKGDNKKLNLLDFCNDAKEIIFDIQNGKPIFIVIKPLLDLETFEVVFSPVFEIITKTKDDICSVIATAIALDIPIYPNSEDVSISLADYHKDLIVHGFKSKNESGKEIRLRLTKYKNVDIESVRFFEKYKTQEMLFPTEFMIMRAIAMKELKEREEAGQVLTRLRSAVKELSLLLDKKKVNENDLQRCLTANSILFGIEYKRLIPKHRLGSEYEMDYALERISGLVDLVEIEASNHPLYTKSGQPSQYLVHAEQQVLNWLSWIEKHSSYARSNLPGLQRPFGYIIIGRERSLTSDNRDRLIRRNIAFRDTFQIMTYDDLLQRANNLLKFLTGKNSVDSGL